MGEPMQLLIHSAKQVVQITAGREKVLTGGQLKNIMVLNAKAEDGLSIVVDRNGQIVAIGFDSEIKTQFRNTTFERRVDASELCVLPGFIDAHTHPVWAGDRVHEFRMKLAGASYMDIHNAGGGIHLTVEHTRRASEEELFRSLRDRLIRMLRSGSTVVECKSGYGLDTETEMKSLRVLERAKRELTFVDISITYCGAHAIPRDMTEDAATRLIIDEQLPTIARSIRLGEISVDNIDVFCEKGVFEVENSKKILEAGRDMGFRINFHADEIHPLGGADFVRKGYQIGALGTRKVAVEIFIPGKMGTEIKAHAISHLEQISDQAINEMGKNGTIAVIIPTTAYILRLPSPPVRKLIEAGVPIALGSDFNPNAFCLSMPMVMHLACILFKMSMEEALVASTLNAAASIGMSETHGSIEVGKKADFVLFDVPTWEHVIYQFGEYDHLIQVVIKNGQVAYDKSAVPK